MAYTPENNPYIPGDPYSYDLKWIVQEVIKKYKTIGPGEVTEDKIADGAVTTPKIADGAVTDSKIENYTSLLNPFVTPEMFGAIGDGVTDDIQAITDCLNSGVKHIVMGKSYYISTPITNVNTDMIIDGGGSIIAATSAFEIDGKRQFHIKDLNISYYTNAIHITSTNSYVQYADFSNLVLTGHGSGSNAVYIERTTNHLSELHFTNVICWSCDKGFVIYNPDLTASCAAHRFLMCSAESALTCGFDITNSPDDTLIFCRTAENYGYKIKTTGRCYRLTILSTFIYSMAPMDFSTETNGSIYGFVRSYETPEMTFGGNYKIVGGKIIPNNELLTEDYSTSNVNSDISYPFPAGTNVDFKNSWHKYASSASTLTLDPDYYGGRGLINDLYITMGANAGAITVVNGTRTFTLPSDPSEKTYHIKFLHVSVTDFWAYEELTKLT